VYHKSNLIFHSPFRWNNNLSGGEVDELCDQPKM